MNIITVIPLSRGKFADELSYFTADEVPVGAIVDVPLRSKIIHGIVSGVRSAADMKSEIKNAPFEIRKLTKLKATAFFPASFMGSCAELREYYASTTGAIINNLTADILLDNSHRITPPIQAQASLDMSRQRVETDNIFAIQGDDADRISSWRSLIRQEFARKRSIAMYVPTIEDGKVLFAALEKGIEGYIFMLSSDMTKKKTIETWESIASTEHPVVVIATSSFALLPRTDIEHVVIERENGRGWISQKAPYMDMRHALQAVARKRRQTVFLADSLLRTETLRRIDAREIDQGSPFKWRSISDARDVMVDMRRKRDERDSAEFRVISRELESLIRTNQEQNTHIFIMCLRRGLSTMTVCADCQAVVICRNCSSPVVLHSSQSPIKQVTGVETENGGRNFFMCHKCGDRRSAEETCRTCGSWNLKPLGIGLDRVVDDITRTFPDIDIFRIDAESHLSERQITDTLEKFRSKPGGVLIGTEMTMLRLSGMIDHIAVVSLDSLLALPDFRIQEKIMYTLTRLRAQASRSILVQTRKPEEKVFEYALKGNLSDFYRATIAERRQFRYPPFGLLIKITIEGKKDAIAEQMAIVKKTLEPREIDIFPAFTSTLRGNSLIHGLVTIDPHSWPDPDLVAKLRTFPPGISVKINPESLL